MPFENFYHETDSRRKTVGLIFLGILLYCLVGAYFYFSHAAESEQILAEKKRIADIDHLCDNLPLPKDLRFVRRDPPVAYRDKTVVVYRYQTIRSYDQMPGDDPTLGDWFYANHWESDPDHWSTFKKGLQTVSIIKTPLLTEAKIFPVDYEIQCSEDDVSFGN